MMKDAIFEAYIIMNLDSAAAREANVTEDNLLTPQQARERALAARHHLDSEVIYLEYSGTFGGDEAVEILSEIDDAVSWSRIWYGGGLDNRENVAAVRDAGADAVVVGDVFHRIARVEADLFEQARDEFDGDVAPDELRKWVAQTVDVTETAANKYLSTIPDLSQADTRATQYLALGLSFGLSVVTLANSLTEPSPTEIRTAVRGHAFDVHDEFATISGVDPEEVTYRLACGLLGRHFDCEMSERSAARHLALEI
jgi:phosphoglycerol geranylgeranyltransferase